MAGSHKVTKPSVSARQGKMKRSWRDKLDPDCVELLDAYRQLGGITTVEEFGDWVDTVGIPREQEGLPNLFPNYVGIRMQLLEIGNMIPTIWLELAGKGLDFSHHLSAMGLHRALTRLVGSLRKLEYGGQPLDEAKRRALAAQCFDQCAKLCRGQAVPPRGRQDVERADLVDFIRRHEKEKLSWEELLEALARTGASVPESPDNLRTWVWRAEKRGLLQRRAQGA
jgi:hypothetical protein